MPGLVIASDKHLTGVIHHLSPSCKNNHTLVRCNCIPFSLPFPEAPKFIVPLRGPTSSTSKGFLDVYVNPGDSKHSILRDERLAWESHSTADRMLTLVVRNNFRRKDCHPYPTWWLRENRYKLMLDSSSEFLPRRNGSSSTVESSVSFRVRLT